MMLDTARLNWMIRRLMSGKTADILAQAEKEWLLCPGETGRTRPAIYPDGELDKIQGLSRYRNWDADKVLITGAEIEHAPARAFLVRNVNISGPFLYRESAKARHGFCQVKLLNWGHVRHQYFETATLVADWAGSEYFGHFLWNTFPIEMLPGPEEHPIKLCSKHYQHEEDYRRLFAMPKPPLVRRARVDRLILYSDFGQNALREVRYRKLRSNLRDALREGEKTVSKPGVFILRGTSGAPRRLLNEFEVTACLHRLGFTIMDPEKLNGEKVASQLLDARIIVSVEGSQFSHAIYTVAEDGVFLALQPPNQFSMSYKEFTDRLGLSFAFLVGEPSQDGFHIDIGNLQRLLERFL